MALRNQPYFPLYVQDYLTDEKLNMCSWTTQGIYIKILCILHKQSSYGSILFKQNYKQNESAINYFASILIKNLPCQYSDMVGALSELIDFEVLITVFIISLYSLSVKVDLYNRKACAIIVDAINCESSY